MTNLEESFSYLKDVLELRGNKVYRKWGEPIFRCNDDIFRRRNNVATERSELSKNDDTRLVYLMSENTNLNGVVINTVPYYKYYEWLKIHNNTLLRNGAIRDVFRGHIPILPILHYPNNRGEKSGEPRVSMTANGVRVYSRFCGHPLTIHKQIYGGKNMPTPRDVANMFNLISGLTYSLTRDAYEQADLVQSDPHPGNFFVEFIESGYYESMYTRGYNVNNIPFNHKYFKFLISEVIESSHSYIPVVRFGDLASLEFTD